MLPATDRQAGISPTGIALRDTDETVTTTRNATRSTVATGSETLSPLTDRLHSEISAVLPLVTDQQEGISSAENALHDAKEVMTTINLSKTWEGALARIKWVMDTLSPVAEVRYNVLFAIPSLSRISSSAQPLCKDGIWSTFCYPQGDTFVLLSY